jgi:hypothetical protein
MVVWLCLVKAGDRFSENDTSQMTYSKPTSSMLLLCLGTTSQYPKMGETKSGVIDVGRKVMADTLGQFGAYACVGVYVCLVAKGFLL